MYHYPRDLTPPVSVDNRRQELVGAPALIGAHRAVRGCKIQASPHAAAA